MKRSKMSDTTFPLPTKRIEHIKNEYRLRDDPENYLDAISALQNAGLSYLDAEATVVLWESGE
jgi:hypothetical protein